MELARLRHWFTHARDTRLFRLRPAEPYPVTLSRRRIFVLPTRAGLLFGATLLVMLLASINYTLSLGYALTFLIAGIGITSTFHAYRNLLDLHVRSGHGEPVHVGDKLVFELQLSDTSGRDRHALRIMSREDQVTINLAAASSAHLQLQSDARQRGFTSIGRVVIETRFPLGLIRAWSVLTPAHTVLVYPAMESDPPAIPQRGDEQDGDVGATEGTDEFAGLREHRNSDSPRQMAWKAIARTDTLISKAFTTTTGQGRVLNWSDLPRDMDVEARLSRLTRWVVDAAAGGHAYTLCLPEITLGPGHDAVHRARCLEALALFGTPASA